MKHILIAGVALLALSACGAPEADTAAETETVAEVVETVETQAAKDAKAKFAAMKARNEATAAEGAAFLAKNAKMDGVITTESGLQYKVVQAGLENGMSAQPGQGIAAHYHGFFIDGEVFDSSYKRGRALTGPSNAFIKGWNEALGEMKVCEARTLYINSDLAYGSKDGRGIPGGSTLLFHMQLLGVAGEENPNLVRECPKDKILSGPEAY